jgi:hypothetical protein
MRNLLRFVAVIILAFSVIGAGGMSADKTEPEPGFSASQTYTHHAPMVISSNADFTSEGWIGLGTLENPYTIEFLEFTSSINDACISISNTTSWFRIKNCIFSSSSYANGIVLQNVVNGQIQQSMTTENITGIIVSDSANIQLVELTLHSTCIIMERASICNVSFCTIDSAPGDGIFFMDCNEMTAQGNIISSCVASGISLENTTDAWLVGNIIQFNMLQQIYVSASSNNNHIYNNDVYDGSFGIALDNGYGNSWDDGVSIGNYWSDYGGSGVYNIPGSAGAIDHFPRNTPGVVTTTRRPIIFPGEVVVTTWAEMDLSMRTILALALGASYGALVLIFIKKFR